MLGIPASNPETTEREGKAGVCCYCRFRMLDMYLDPDRPGFNEVHGTFIGADGNELPVPRLAVITAGRPGGAPQQLPVRRFGPGHFIGDATLTAGDWEIAVTVTARDGSGLQARVVVHLR